MCEMRCQNRIDSVQSKVICKRRIHEAENCHVRNECNAGLGSELSELLSHVDNTLSLSHASASRVCVWSVLGQSHMPRPGVWRQSQSNTLRIFTIREISVFLHTSWSRINHGSLIKNDLETMGDDDNSGNRCQSVSACHIANTGTESSMKSQDHEVGGVVLNQCDCITKPDGPMTCEISVHPQRCVTRGSVHLTMVTVMVKGSRIFKVISPASGITHITLDLMRYNLSF